VIESSSFSTGRMAGRVAQRDATMFVTSLKRRYATSQNTLADSVLTLD
jgi:hypothetical protein